MAPTSQWQSILSLEGTHEANTQKNIAKEKGFSLIEVLVVIAIIGILAGIAIPSFISYRNNAYCSAVESDAYTFTTAIANYYASPSRAKLLTLYYLPNVSCSGKNTAVISGSLDAIVITVTDASGLCPQDYLAVRSFRFLRVHQLMDS